MVLGGGCLKNLVGKLKCSEGGHRLGSDHVDPGAWSCSLIVVTSFVGGRGGGGYS